MGEQKKQVYPRKASRDHFKLPLIKQRKGASCIRFITKDIKRVRINQRRIMTTTEAFTCESNSPRPTVLSATLPLKWKTLENLQTNLLLEQRGKHRRGREGFKLATLLKLHTTEPQRNWTDQQIDCGSRFEQRSEETV